MQAWTCAVTALTVGVNGNNNEVPASFELKQNYPNPFNPNTSISFNLPKESSVTLEVFDITGKNVATLVNETKAAGKYSYDFNASDLSSGIYFYKLTADGFTSTKKMILSK